MSTAITPAFEAYLATQTAAQQPVVLDEFVFANVPGLDPEAPVDPAEGIPQTQIVWRQAVDKSGVINSDTVVYSVLLGTEVGDFTFNWVGLINKSSGMLAMVTHIPPQEKYANVDGNQGNALTRSFVMEYSGAQAATLINVPAETWQIDFTARLGAMDEHDRVTNVDLYGPGAFFGDGFLVRESAGAYSIQPGAGYVGGLRVLLGAAAPVNAATRPTKVWVDASWTGTAASVWNTQQTITVAPTLANYVQDGISHYVFAVAQINADGSVTDLRPKGTVDGGQQASLWLRKDKNLSDVNDAAEGRKSLGCGTSATKDIVTSPTDTTAGRVLTVGAGGLLSGARNTTIANESFASFWRDTTEVKAGITMPYDGSPTLTFLAVDGANHSAYIGRKVGANPISWVKIFSEFNKPTAADTGALPIGGGRLTGNLEIYAAAPILQLTESDTGKKYFLVADGGNIRLDEDSTTGNNVFLWTSATNTLSVNGKVIPGDYGNFDDRYINADGAKFAGFVSGDKARPYMRHRVSDEVVVLAKNGDSYTKGESDARYVTGVQFGAVIQVNAESYTAPAGHVLVGVVAHNGNYDTQIDAFKAKPIQRQINNQWVTIPG
ncbi:phage tail protein [Enterobacter kobei]|nr:phage tail protein [Enterobacter kobei]